MYSWKEYIHYKRLSLAHFTVHGCTYYCAIWLQNFWHQAYPFDLPFPIYYITCYHLTYIIKLLTHKRIQMAERLDPIEVVRFKAILEYVEKMDGFVIKTTKNINT